MLAESIIIIILIFLVITLVINNLYIVEKYRKKNTLIKLAKLLQEWLYLHPSDQNLHYLQEKTKTAITDNFCLYNSLSEKSGCGHSVDGLPYNQICIYCGKITIVK